MRDVRQSLLAEKAARPSGRLDAGKRARLIQLVERGTFHGSRAASEADRPNGMPSGPTVERPTDVQALYLPLASFLATRRIKAELTREVYSPPVTQRSTHPSNVYVCVSFVRWAAVSTHALVAVLLTRPRHRKDTGCTARRQPTRGSPASGR